MNDNKTAAEEALKRIPAIDQTITEADEKTREARLALGSAAADAAEAKNKAHEAERIASAVQKVRAPATCSQLSGSRKTGVIDACLLPFLISLERPGIYSAGISACWQLQGHEFDPRLPPPLP